jgi:hypothetical protein
MTTKAKLLIVVAVLVAGGIGFFAGYEVERERVVNALTSGLTHASKELQKEAVAVPHPKQGEGFLGKEGSWSSTRSLELRRKIEKEKTPILTEQQAICSTEHLTALYTATEFEQISHVPLNIIDEIKTACGIAQ